MKGDKIGQMKRADDFWVTGPFSCYFLKTEFLSCYADMMLAESGRLTLWEPCMFNTKLWLHFCRSTEEGSKQLLQDKNTFGNWMELHSRILPSFHRAKNFNDLSCHVISWHLKLLLRFSHEVLNVCPCFRTRLVILESGISTNFTTFMQILWTQSRCSNLDFFSHPCDNTFGKRYKCSWCWSSLPLNLSGGGLGEMIGQNIVWVKGVKENHHSFERHNAGVGSLFLVLFGKNAIITFQYIVIQVL